VWNKNNNWTPRPTQGREAVVDDQRIIEEETHEDRTATPQQTTNTWLRGIANKREEVRDLIMRDLLGKEDFPSA